MKIRNHIDGLQDKCTGVYVKRLNLIRDVVDMIARQPNQTVIDTYVGCVGWIYLTLISTILFE